MSQSREARSNLLVEDVESLLIEIKGYARAYGGKLKIIKGLGSKFLQAEGIMPLPVNEEYIPQTESEKQTTLPHVKNHWSYSGLYRQVDGLQRLLIKESMAVDIHKVPEEGELPDILPQESDDEFEVSAEAEEAELTLNTHRFYRFVWGDDGIQEATMKASQSIDKRPRGFQKYHIRTVDAETGEVRLDVIRSMTSVDEAATGDPFWTIVDRNPEFLALRVRMAQYADILALQHDSEIQLSRDMNSFDDSLRALMDNSTTL